MGFGIGNMVEAIYETVDDTVAFCFGRFGKRKHNIKSEWRGREQRVGREHDK